MSQQLDLYDVIVASGVDPSKPVGLITVFTPQHGPEESDSMLGYLVRTVPQNMPNVKDADVYDAYVVHEADEFLAVVGLSIADVPPIPADGYGLMLVIPERMVYVGQGPILLAQIESIAAGQLNQVV